MALDRRSFLIGSGAAAVPLLLAGCGFVRSSPSQQTEGTLTFTTWGTDAELAGFRDSISAFEAANPGSTITLNAVPYEQMFTNIDAQLQAGNPPDIFRVPYYTFGAYAGRGQLLDLSPLLASDTRDQFTPTAWAAVQNGGIPYGLPHHTDTSAILVNRNLLSQAGIDSVPTSLDDAWTWDELASIGDRLRSSLPADKYPWAYNWQGNGVTRWLSLLFQAGGSFLAEDQKTPLIDSDDARRAVEFSSSFFSNGYVPANNTIASSSYASEAWFSQSVAMVWSGAFQLPDADATASFDWTATFAPRDRRGGGDFGGNALVATSQTSQPELAASFLEFVTQQEQMRNFCRAASLLPTRTDLLNSDLEFDIRSELAPIFAAQATTVQPQDAAQVASPSMSAIIPVLKEQLDLAFAGSQDAAATVSALQSGIAGVTGA
ncbi:MULTISPECIES: ABC transporter substrate-binding protein [unclassified Rhodococcus (in: high G+C Gram-positive bacteria)]|uniref:ABC transporter substrate-binding protein n=1 Tax=unclassified Rhodococcus (in: high G+C Gram-positive bacteria) TaxID=192944 RepID=UPI000B9A4746|nr:MULTISPECIES: sugar ABC transporter substrate-binding protein [unclassified Rhodococcus (in: high G+C Gram-positive bacteria)]OZE42254.1 sugar ABC transporter substrate-binding protein [Rhodococcus sp. 05-2254-4]OZE49815.1 sugar ABC transporter substrate-binding protein [Rhodococcus sp. 05-2254-3]OZE50453.1 sugar ABC transporter substrate-binding protein [Rhodococcus sp. 05-2254-2]